MILVLSYVCHVISMFVELKDRFPAADALLTIVERVLPVLSGTMTLYR